jgi:putative ABC transport system permease protein
MRHRHFHRELDEELDFHRSMKERELTGWDLPPEEVRHAARRALGNELAAMEDARAVWIWPRAESFWQDLRYAGRTLLLRERGFAFAALFTLALGIGAITAIFSVVNAALLEPPPYPQPERILTLAYPDGSSSQDGQIFHYVREHSRSFEYVAARGGGSGWNLVVGNAAEYVSGLPVSEGFFAVLGVRPLVGRELDSAEDQSEGPRAVVLSEPVWRRLFDSNVGAVGGTVLLGGLPHTVVGVMPAGFRSVPAVDVWTPLRVSPRDSSWNYQVLARLRPGVTPGQAAAELDLLRSGISGELRGISEQRNRGLQWISFQRWMGAASRDTLLLLLGAVGFLLLIACVNVAGLQIARALARRREMATRAALGGGSTRLVQQLLTESLLLALLGGLAGFMLARWSAGTLTALVPPGLLGGQAITLDLRVLLVTLVVALGAGVFFGLAPALGVTRLDLRAALWEGARHTAGRRTMWLRRGFNVMQVALAVVLLVGAGLLIRTFVNLRSAELGFDASNVVVGSMSLQGSARQADRHVGEFFETTLDRIRQIPGVSAAAVASNVPVERALNLPLEPPAESLVGEMRAVDWRYITPEYFEVFGIAVTSGRPFDAHDATGTMPVVIVNEAFVRTYFGQVNALGRQLRVAGVEDPPREVVGVVADVKGLSGSGWTSGSNALGSAAAPTLYVPVAQVPEETLQLVHGYFPMSWAVRTRSPAPAIVPVVQDIVRASEPTLPFIGFRSMHDLIARDLETERFMMILLSFFAAVALGLAAIGMYGLVSYTAGQRTQEVAVRLALGATRPRVLASFVCEGVALGLAGLAGGLAGAMVATRVVKSVLFRVMPLDPLTYFGVAVVIVLVIASASVVPAIRAARISPILALRAE